MIAKSMDIAMKHCALVSLVILALASGLAAQDDLGRGRISGDIEIFFSNQKTDEAIAHFELAIKIKSDWPKACHRLGLVYLNKGDFPKALANLKKFLGLDRQNPEAASVKAAIAAIEQIKK